MEQQQGLARCPACLERFDKGQRSPRSLACGHSARSACLARQLRGSAHRAVGRPSQRKRRGKDLSPAHHLTVVTCARCRKQTRIPDDREMDVALPRQDMPHLEALVRSAGVPPPRAFCAEHEGEPPDLWCETDQRAVCVLCVAAGGSHHGTGHQVIPLEQAKAQIASFARFLEKSLDAVDQALAQVEASEVHHAQQAADARAAIARHVAGGSTAGRESMALGEELAQWERCMAEMTDAKRALLREAKGRLTCAFLPISSGGQRTENSGRGLLDVPKGSITFRPQQHQGCFRTKLELVNRTGTKLEWQGDRITFDERPPELSSLERLLFAVALVCCLAVAVALIRKLYQ